MDGNESQRMTILSVSKDAVILRSEIPSMRCFSSAILAAGWPAADEIKWQL
jgi:hypothetical protein